jgi:uncharacterized Fe-S cluster protein YjdI
LKQAHTTQMKWKAIAIMRRSCSDSLLTAIQVDKIFGSDNQSMRRRHAMQEYRNDKIVVRYDPEICIHAGECVRGLPSVFNVSKNPWIEVNGASATAVAEQVKRCPSSALTYELLKKAD